MGPARGISYGNVSAHLKVDLSANLYTTMFTNISMTGAGVITGFLPLIMLALNFFGVDVAEEQVVSALNGLLGFISLVLLVIGQMRRKDLNFGIMRKLR